MTVSLNHRRSKTRLRGKGSVDGRTENDTGPGVRVGETAAVATSARWLPVVRNTCWTTPGPIRWSVRWAKNFIKPLDGAPGTRRCALNREAVNDEITVRTRSSTSPPARRPVRVSVRP